MRQNDGEIHFKYVRVSPPVFDKQLDRVRPHLRKRRRYWSKVRATITDADKLVLTLKYLVSGASAQDVSISLRPGHSTAHKIITEVCKAIWLPAVPEDTFWLESRCSRVLHSVEHAALRRSH
eukprot:scpid42287/ scgid33945/ 